MPELRTNIVVRRFGADETVTKINPQFPNHPHGPVFVELDGPSTSLRFDNLNHLNEWVGGLRCDVDVLLERRDAQQTFGGAA